MALLPLLLAPLLAFGPADDDARLVEARLLLTRLVAEAPNSEDPAAAWRDGLEKTAEVLGRHSLNAETLRAVIVASARQSGAEEVSGLEKAARGVLADLLFEPVKEAETPEGFPEATPVGEIRVKTYPAYRLARARSDGPMSAGAFWKLFQHIKSNDIAMTAPVEMTWSEKDGREDEVAMAFLYGRADLGSTGADGDVRVEDVEPMTVVSVGLRGNSRRDAILAARVKLEAWIEAEKERWRAAGDLRTMGWNGPTVRGKKRYYEVQIPIAPAKAKGEERQTMTPLEKSKPL